MGNNSLDAARRREAPGGVGSFWMRSQAANRAVVLGLAGELATAQRRGTGGGGRNRGSAGGSASALKGAEDAAWLGAEAKAGGGSHAVEATTSVAGRPPLGTDGLRRAYSLGRLRCGSGLRARPG
jgi:hypothetical protein